MSAEKLKEEVFKELEIENLDYATKKEIEEIVAKIKTRSNISPEEIEWKELNLIKDLGSLKYLPTKDLSKLVNLETGEVIDIGKYGKIVIPSFFDDTDSTYLGVLTGETPLLIVKDEEGRYKLINIENDKLLLEGEKIEVSSNLITSAERNEALFVIRQESGKYNLFFIDNENNLKHILDIKPYDPSNKPALLFEEIQNQKKEIFEIEDEKGKIHTLAVEIKNDPYRTVEVSLDNETIATKQLRPYKVIVSHLPPRHLDDTLALHLLGSIFNPEYSFVHPQSEELEKLKEDPNVILVDVGGDYNPKKGNFDHHQDPNIPSSVMLVIDHYAPHLKTLSEDLRRFLEIVDKIDRFGFPKVAKEENIPPDNTIPILMKAYLSISQKIFEKGEPLFKNFFDFREHLSENSKENLPVYIKRETGETVKGYFYPKNETITEYIPKNSVKLPSQLISEVKKMLSRGIVPLIDLEDITPRVYEKETYNPILYYLYKEEKKTLNPESLKNPYSKFFATAIKDLPQELVNEFINNLKEEKARKEEILKNVKIVNFLNLKTIVDLSDNPLGAGEYFGAYPDAGLLIQKNTMNKNHTSIVKNTRLPQTENVNLKDLYKILGKDKEVFTHQTGFITVVNMPIEKVLDKLNIKLENKKEIKKDYGNSNAPSI